MRRRALCARDASPRWRPSHRGDEVGDGRRRRPGPSAILFFVRRPVSPAYFTFTLTLTVGPRRADRHLGADGVEPERAQQTSGLLPFLLGLRARQ